MIASSGRPRRTGVGEKGGIKERNQREKRAHMRARRTSAESFERENALSNFQFSQSGPKIRDRAPVMAEVQ